MKALDWQAPLDGEIRRDGWGDLASLPGGLPPVEPFAPELLPVRLRPWIMDVAERMQCPPDFPAAALVVALGSTVGRRCGIRPKRRDDWLVVPNLWGGSVGRPSLLKTPALQEALRPLRRLEAEAGTAHREALKAHEANLAVAKQAKKLREAQIAKDLKAKRDPKGIVHDFMQAEEAFDAPIECRYLTNDPTVEKLGELLRDNPVGAMLFRDELVGWLKGLDKDGREGDRAFYLECWDGTGAPTSTIASAAARSASRPRESRCWAASSPVRSPPTSKPRRAAGPATTG